MSRVRRVLHAFLASPSDLQEERDAVRRAVAEVNELWAHSFGYQVELLGWEDTPPRFGRPQELINRDLDRCDFFIGMLWKRWGTPPGHDSSFSSGFQEEFERSRRRMEATGSPEICLFFKKIPSDYLDDPGDDLKSVMDFRQSIISGKQLLFANFDTVQDMEALARRSISDYVKRVKAAETTVESGEVREKSSTATSDPREIGDTSVESSFLSTKHLAFLDDLVENIKQAPDMERISAPDVARFRLLANSITRPNNDKIDLGVHDINLLYFAYVEGLSLDKKEILWLSRLGFRYLSNENVPLWCWYSNLSDYPINVAVFSSVIGDDDDEKIGAIRSLTGLEHDFSSDEERTKRKNILDDWFSVESSDDVKSAALAYLAKMGQLEDYDLAENEYARDNHRTSSAALNCMVSILLRVGDGNAAQELILKSQFDSLDQGTLTLVLDGFDNVETPALFAGLKHRHPSVRLQTLRVLHARGDLDQAMAEPLVRDRDASVRNEAFETIVDLGGSFTSDEIRNILVRPNKKSSVGFLGTWDVPASDEKGEEFWDRYQMNILKGYSEVEITKAIQRSLLYDDHPYFARVERYFRKYVNELRKDIDDTFATYFNNKIQRMEAALLFSGQDVISDAKSLEDYSRKKLTRRGLDILCRQGRPEDLERIRTNLETGYTTASVADAEFLRKLGKWRDIPLLVNASGPVFTNILFGENDFPERVSRSVIAMSRGRSVSMLVSLDMPPQILNRIIQLCPLSRFAKISNESLLKLFGHESKEVRKAAAIKTVQVLPTKRIRSILHEYIGGDIDVYYNVLHWLDLGASIPRGKVRNVIREGTSSYG